MAFTMALPSSISLDISLHSFLLTQTGLIEKVIKAGGIEDCNKVATPAEASPVGADLDGLPFNETWEYAPLVGMLLYLASNPRPYIAYAVHQAARYSHGTKNSHAIAVKRILRYLEGTPDKGIIFKPNKSNKIDCRVDSNFAGLFGVEDGLKPICAKSRTGYVIKFCDVHILWVSKMQTQIALSTMEAEYIALSQSMRDLIPIREILKEIMLEVLDKNSSQNVPHTPKHS
jgi:hypothetical protein